MPGHGAEDNVEFIGWINSNQPDRLPLINIHCQAFVLTRKKKEKKIATSCLIGYPHMSSLEFVAQQSYQ